MASTVGEKGQIVIEKGIRDALGIRPGFIAVQTPRAGHLEVHFYPPEHNRSLLGVLANATQVSVPPEDWEEARERAWEEAVLEEEGLGLRNG